MKIEFQVSIEGRSAEGFATKDYNTIEDFTEAMEEFLEQEKGVFKFYCILENTTIYLSRHSVNVVRGIKKYNPSDWDSDWDY